MVNNNYIENIGIRNLEETIGKDQLERFKLGFKLGANYIMPLAADFVAAYLTWKMGGDANMVFTIGWGTYLLTSAALYRQRKLLKKSTKEISRKIHNCKYMIRTARETDSIYEYLLVTGVSSTEEATSIAQEMESQGICGPKGYFSEPASMLEKEFEKLERTVSEESN